MIHTARPIVRRCLRKKGETSCICNERITVEAGLEMETLLEEMVELIAQHLTPEDLCHCSAVSRSWYEVFNQDRLWKRHCDVGLEEALRVIPNVATPFRISAAEDSKLPLISKWKLAFLKEKHLWKSWRTTGVRQLKKEYIGHEINGGKNLLGVDFLTDRLITAWYHDRIEVLDVTVMPAVIAAITNNTVKIGRLDKRCVVGENVLTVEKEYSIQVFEVDIDTKSITMKHDIVFKTDWNSRKGCIAKEKVYLFIDDSKSKLKILNLFTGEIVEHECPVKMNQKVRVSLESIKSSPTSDFVVVLFLLHDNTLDSETEQKKVFIYSIKQFTFLSDSLIMSSSSKLHDVALYGNWIAVSERFLRIFYILPTGEVIFSKEICIPNLQNIQVCSDSFVCTNFKDIGFFPHIVIYFPLTKTLKMMDTRSRYKPLYLYIISNKVIGAFVCMAVCILQPVFLKCTGENFERCEDFPVLRDFFTDRVCKINQSFTKVIIRINHPSLHYLCNGHSQLCWYIAHMW